MARGSDGVDVWRTRVSSCATTEMGHACGRAHLLIAPIALVADQDLVDAFGSMLLDVGVPGADVCP